MASGNPDHPATQAGTRAVAQPTVSFRTSPCHRDPRPGARPGCLCGQARLPSPFLSVRPIVWKKPALPSCAGEAGKDISILGWAGMGAAATAE